jgi:hypothetical protein
MRPSARENAMTPKPGMLALILLTATAALGADPPNPSVAVIGFDGAAGVRVSPTDSAALADDLAAKLADTGRFRVLPLEWLPGGQPDNRPRSIEALRSEARRAGVEYLITGSISRVRGKGGARLSPMSVLVFAAGLRMGSPALLRCAPVTHADGTLSIQARAIDVDSGRVIRTSLAESHRPVASSTGGCVPRPPVRMVDVGSPSQMDGLRQANGDIASVLQLPADPMGDDTTTTSRRNDRSHD